VQRSPNADTELLGLLPRPGMRSEAQPEGPAGAAELSTPLVVLAVALSYFLGSSLGLSLPFPSTQISAIWPPNAILLAVLLLTPRRRWWIYLLAVFPVHLLVQMMKEIPLQIVLINFAGNIGEAVLGAVAILHYAPEPRRLDRLRTVLSVMLFGGLVAPALTSLVVAALFAWMGLGTAPFLTWLLRLLTNALAVLTLVPSIVLAATQVRSLRRTLAPWRAAEAAALLVALLAVGIFIFVGPEAGQGRIPFHLYVPFPFLLWAAVRFGLLGISLSVLLLNVVAIYSAIHGHGPFTAQLPNVNAASMVLFLLVACAPLQMLAALLAESEIMEEKHRRAETLHSAVLNSLQDHFGVVDRKGVIIEVNESWQRFVRDSGLSWMHRASLGVNYLEVCRIAARSNQDASSEKALAGLEAILSGNRKRFQMEYSLPTSLGELWFEMSAEPLRRLEGGAVIRHTEITGRRQAEQEAREQRRELAHLTRVALLGELSGALAHELNQPLTAILSNAQAGQRLLAREPVDLAEIREVLKDIADDDRRAGAVIHRLRAMLKKEELALQPIDLGEIAREVLDLAHSDLITRNVRVTTRLAAGLPLVRGDRVQLQQVLLNLVLNACESIDTGGPSDRKLTVTTARVTEGVQVSVSDRGTGIAAGALSRLFEPFFTTKQHGLGLGLSICRSIVAEHGGRLWATNNEVEGGATFHLVLPVAERTQP
jgi:signal transduction histidine kinase/integral membrane sensor domain MASE1